MPKLVVVMAFDFGEDGELGPAGEPEEAQSEEQAVRKAKVLAQSHAGVLAWSRVANPNLGEYGEPVELFRHGEVAELE